MIDLSRIEKKPGICGGRAHIRGTHIAVWSLVHARRLGVTSHELMMRYAEPLSAADLTAAWDYYDQNTSEIDEDIRCMTGVA